MSRSIFWLILQGCWGAFAVVWVSGMFYNLARGPKVQRRLISLPVFAFAAVLILIAAGFALLRSQSLIALASFGFERLAGVSPLWMGVIGVVLLVPSTGLTLWARLALGTMWSNMAEAKIGHQLRTDGPYGITRHPIYTGMIGMLLGSLLIGAVGAWALIALAGTAFVLVKVPAEEKLMIETFGEQYRQYQQRVPQIIPGLQFLKKRPFGNEEGSALPHMPNEERGPNDGA